MAYVQSPENQEGLFDVIRAFPSKLVTGLSRVAGVHDFAPLFGSNDEQVEQIVVQRTEVSETTGQVALAGSVTR